MRLRFDKSKQQATFAEHGCIRINSQQSNSLADVTTGTKLNSMCGWMDGRCDNWDKVKFYVWLDGW